MDNFLKLIQPYILSEDFAVQRFALENIDSALMGNDETFELALKANDKNNQILGKNSILPYTNNYRIGQKGMRLLVDHIKNNDDNLIWYLSILSHCDPELIEDYYDEIKPIVGIRGKAPLENLIKLNHLSTEKLLEELTEVLGEMEEQKYYNGSLFTFSKHIIDNLIKRNGIAPKEVERAIRKELDADFFSYKGILLVYAAGKMKIQTLVKDLSGLLLRTDEDVLLEEVEKALIRMGSEEVIKQVAQFALHLDNYYSPIAILGNIKSEYAINTLLNLFDHAPDLTSKTLMAEALCKQLSIDGVPKIEALIEEGYDQTLLPLEDDLYANCVINGIGHSKLQEWKTLIEDRESQFKKLEEELSKGNKQINSMKIELNKSVKSTNVGRNDPCPCQSGKKYKKCCGK
ncbi:MAG: SEC-C metal-binding domain-containing protein [Tuberibacillus sp.]